MLLKQNACQRQQASGMVHAALAARKKTWLHKGCAARFQIAVKRCAARIKR
jgi:hypothetical protein